MVTSMQLLRLCPNCIIRHNIINVERAKCLTVCLVIMFIVCHGAFRYKYGNDSCDLLMTSGRFRGQAWQPDGCMMHLYTKSDVRSCFQFVVSRGGHNHFAFIGDSRQRQLYSTFTATFPNSPRAHTRWKHISRTFIDDTLKLTVDFLWQPYIDMAMYNVCKAWAMRNPKDRPGLISAAAALWPIKEHNASLEMLKETNQNLARIAPYFKRLKKTTRVVWMMQAPLEEHKVKDATRECITNRILDRYNRDAAKVLQNNVSHIWRSARLVSKGFKNNTEDGIHEVAKVLFWDKQMLFNLYCNNKTRFNDGTCCRSAEPITILQMITAAVFGLCMIVASLLWAFHRLTSFFRRNRNEKCIENGPDGSNPSNDTIIAKPEVEEKGYYVVFMTLAKLGLIMTYFFMCDRADFFMKENKSHTPLHFFLPVACVMVLGFFFTEESKETSLLHRNQTDEWKGWMQLVILIYHITGTSRVLPVYMHIRVLVSSYFFLSGYGHFSYYWKTGTWGIQRVCQVLFRLNMLVVCLCFTMNRPYQFYYFIPLVSFWFLCVYVTMVWWPQSSTLKADVHLVHYVYMIVKLVILAALVTLLFLFKKLFETLFLTKPFKALFVIDDSLHEWRFRWQLDRYSVIYGMAFAFACHGLRKFKLLNDTGGVGLFRRSISFIVILFSVLGISSYTIFSMYCHAKEECNDVHSYIVFLPILSYIFLRNTFGIIRQKYSTFFAWFGRISLELFIAQYHIWLAADTHGVLVLVPGNQVLNVIFTAFIFVCTCHEIHKITTTLAKYAVPNDWKIALRNSILFSLILIPIGWKHGVFF